MNIVLKLLATTFVALQLGIIFTPSALAATEEETAAIETDGGGKTIREKTQELLKDKLITPYSKKVKKEVSRKSFSRCPSGFRTTIEQEAAVETEYSYGGMNLWEGCEPTEICRYRVRLSDKSVEILQGDSVNYMAVDLWINNATSSIR